jgi:hypothetical protein
MSRTFGYLAPRSANPDQGHDADQPGRIVDQELRESEITDLGHPPGWVIGPDSHAEQPVVRVFADACQNLYQEVEPLSGQAPHLAEHLLPQPGPIAHGPER